MVIPLLVLIGGTLLMWAAVLSSVGEEAKNAATLAMVITLPPAVTTLLAVVTVSRRWATAGPPIVMVGTFLRMGAAVGAVALLNDRAAEFGTTASALSEWTTGFYLLTLAIETGLLWWLLSGAGQTRVPVEVRPDGPTADEFRR